MRGLFRHAGLKIVAVGLAATLWLLVSGEQVVERALRVPLELTNLPERLDIVGEPPTSVDVRVRGSSGALSRIAPGEIMAVLDLRSAKSGQRLFHLRPVDVRSSFGIQVVQVTPSNVSIRLEPTVSKFVPVVPGVDGEPASGFVVGEVTATPQLVEVVGPASVVSGLTEAITEPVSIAGARATVIEAVTVGSPDPQVRLRAPVTARVTVAVTAAPMEWTVTGVRVQARNAGRQVEIVPSDVLVRARGPVGAGGARASDFDASVDVAGLHAGVFELPVRVAPPTKIGVVRVEPAQVRVRIR